ncbi:MAG: M57 family metalloprotease [Actinomycetota bacterium]|nr:M57 family metalloprotease [Actinomycetota bacterium]
MRAADHAYPSWFAPAVVTTLALGVVAMALILWPLMGLAAKLDTREGRPWPAHRPIRIHDASAWPRTVRAAVKEWNDTRIAPRMAMTPDRRSADVLVVSGLAGPGAAGRVDFIGYKKGRQSTLTIPRSGRSAGVADRDLPVLVERVVVHELGHVLGLRHQLNGCAVMNPEGASGECSVKVIAERRAPLATDRRALRRLYDRR